MRYWQPHLWWNILECQHSFFIARHHARMKTMCQRLLTLWGSSCLSWWMFTTLATLRKSQVSYHMQTQLPAV